MPWCRCGARRTGGRRSARPGRRNTRGNTNPKKGFGFPQHLREREREKEKKTERKASSTNIPNSQKKEREDNEHQCEQGAGLEGHQNKQHLDPRDQKNHTNKPKHISRKHRTKNQSPIKQSLGGIITAGWRGPWAALHFWGDTPGDRSTEGSEDPPTTGTAPGSARAGMLPDTKLRPQKCCPSTWPFLKYRTRPQITKQTQNDNRANMKPKHDRATKPTHFPVTRLRKNVVRGAPRGGGWAPPPFVLSRKSLRFLGSAMGIAIANRKNRCDFGALSFGPFSGGGGVTPNFADTNFMDTQTFLKERERASGGHTLSVLAKWGRTQMGSDRT